MKQTILAAAAVALCACTVQKIDDGSPMFAAFEGKFTIGTSLNLDQIHGRDVLGQTTFLKHFNSMEPENCMKSEEIHPEEGYYNWADADAYVDLGVKNGKEIIGHCLIWHSQCPEWFFVDADGNPASPELLKQRMRDHIFTVMGRYKGKITGWDVVNEAIVEDGSYRNSKFYQILGEEFIPWAFQCAHEADPDCRLFYNDYGMNNPGRREGVVRLIRQLKERGCRIDAVGMQAHIGMDYPDFDEFRQAIEAYTAEGVHVVITEWDMSALPTASQSANISDKEELKQDMNPYTDGLPDSVSAEWNKRAKAFWQILLDYSDVIDRVNVWGLQDGDSWKNDFPMNGRTDYPLLFDRKLQMKPFMKELISELNEKKN